MPNGAIVRDYGKINAWELCTRLKRTTGGGNPPGNVQISPSDADYFLHLLFSRSSDRIAVEEINSVDNWVYLYLTGPPGSGGRSTAGFKLSRDALNRCLPEEGDGDAFVARLWELGYNEEDVTEACKALRLRESNHP